MEPVKIINTGHNNGILHLAFSCNGNYLISIAFDPTFSMQIFMIEKDFNLIFKNLGSYPIFFVKFFYSCEEKFITLGYRHAIIWKIKGNTLKK